MSPSTPTADGTWEVNLEAFGNSTPATLVLATVDGKLTGTMSTADDTLDVVKAVLAGDALTWETTLTKPMKMKLKFQATIDGDSISGKGKAMMGSLILSGTRVGSGVAP
jgi:hypothetical protein